MPDAVEVKKVRTVEEKDSVLSLLSSSEVDHEQSAFLFNKVALYLSGAVLSKKFPSCMDSLL